MDDWENDTTSNGSTYATINVENSGAAKSLRNENIGGGILLTTYSSLNSLYA